MKLLKMVTCMSKTISILTVCLEIIRNLIRPSLTGRTAPSMGLGFFSLLTQERAEVFINLWMLVVTVLVQFFVF